jgi:dUTP pyrophosphatase
MKIQILDPAQLPGGPHPLRYATPESAGLDVRTTKEVVLYPGQQRLVKLGFKAAIPPGYAGLLLSRSGNALKLGVTLGNSVGLIDSDYRGEWMALLHNHSDPGTPAVVLAPYTRVAQLVIVPYHRVSLEYVEELDTTARTGGFGHSGEV